MHSSLSTAVRNTLLAARNTLLIAASVAALTISTVAPSAAQAPQTGGTPPPNPLPLRHLPWRLRLPPPPVDSDIHNIQYQPINPGAVVSVTGYFNRYLGLQAEGNFFPHGPNDCVFGAQERSRRPPSQEPLRPLRPRPRRPEPRSRRSRLPTLHLGRGESTSGHGLRLHFVPAFNNHLAIRPPSRQTSPSPRFSTARSSSQAASPKAAEPVTSMPGSSHGGLVLRFGATSVPPPVQFGCTIQPCRRLPRRSRHSHRNRNQSQSQTKGHLHLDRQRQQVARQQRNRDRRHSRPGRRRLHRQGTSIAGHPPRPAG